MNEGTRMHATANNQAWTIALLNDCHSMALAHLRPHLDKLFMNSDLAFLEFAEKAQTEASQIRFMEAMSIIQKHRTHIEEVFLREVGRSFAEFGNNLGHAAQGAGYGHEPLTLMSLEDTDIQVAIQNMVCSAALGSTLTLSALRKRLAVLNHGRMPEDRQIPAGPHSLANAFHQAVKELILEHETRLLVYMLFDRFVLSKTCPLYDQYNQHLVKSGILPHLRYEVKKNPSAQSAGQRRTQGATNRAHRPAHDAQRARDGDSRQAVSDALFGEILQLLSRHVTATDSVQDAVRTNAGQPPVQHVELVSGIHRLQTGRRADSTANHRVLTPVLDQAQHAQLVSATLERLNAERDQLFREIDRRRLPGTDTRIIDLVGMMFEFMLRDREIPGIAKAELSRLHTPYLKIAILDKGLFTDSSHPAHVLLNRLASAATRWVFEDDLERGVFPTLRSIVQRIIEEFDSDLDLFTELLEQLEATLQSLENKSAAIEERSRQAEQGKERLGTGRAWAARAIQERISGHHIPASLRSMLSDVWMNKLTFIYLREADAGQSASWRLACQTIESMIWSCEPRRTEKQREELRARLPDVRRQIRHAMDTLSVYGSSDDRAQLALIRELQDEAARTGEREAVAEIDDPVHGQQPASEATVAAAEVAEPVPGQQPAGAATATAVHEQPAPGLPSSDAEAELSEAEQSALARLEQVVFGSWFVFQKDENTLPRRLKLSWYSRVSGTYMFVNSMGVKSLTRKHHELASLLAAGQAWIVDGTEQPFMQRTMRRIRGMLGAERPLPA